MPYLYYGISCELPSHYVEYNLDQEWIHFNIFSKMYSDMYEHEKRTQSDKNSDINILYLFWKERVKSTYSEGGLMQ